MLPQLEAIAAKISAIESSIATIGTDIKSKEVEISAEVARTAILEGEIDRATGDSSHLQERRADAVSREKSLRQEKEDLRKEKQDLQTQVNLLLDEKKDLRSRVGLSGARIIN